MSAKRNSPGLRAPIVRASAMIAAAACVAFAALSGAVLSAAPATAAPSAGPTGPTQVAVIVPMTVPDARNGLLSAATLANYTAPAGLLTRALDAVIDTPAAIGIDPLIAVSIELLGTDAPASATAWLERLDESTNETFALTWADSDITAALQAGSPTVLAPTSLDFAIDSELFGPPAPTSTPGPTVEEPTDPLIPPLPTTASLLDREYSLDGIAWPVAGTVVAADLVAIEASGYTTTVLGSRNVDRSDVGLAAAMIGETEALITDDELSERLATTSAMTSLPDWQESLAALGGAIDASGATSTILAVDRTMIGSPERLRSTIVALDVLEGLVVGTLADVVTAGSTTATVVDSPNDPELVAATAAALQAEAADAAFAAIAADPTRIIAERRLSLLSALAPSWMRYATGSVGALAEFGSESLELRGSVQILSESDIIFPDRGFLPVTVSNTLDQPVTVYVVVTAQSPLLDIEDPWVETVIEPNSQRRALIPAVARSNGIVTLSVGLASASGLQVGTPVAVTANVQAGWETPLTIGLGVVLVLVFASGIYRTIVRRRKARSGEVDATAPGAASDTNGGE